MAKIGIDATSVSPQGKGVRRYQKNITRALSQMESKHEYFIFFNQKFCAPPFIGQPHWQAVPVHAEKAIFWEQAGIPYWIRRLQLDLFHTTTDRLPRLGQGRFVLQLFEIPNHRVRLANESAKPQTLYRNIADRLTLKFFPYTLDRADRILVSSRSTQRELAEKYEVDSAKTKVVPLSHEPDFKPADDPDFIKKIREKNGAPSGYALHFSTGDPRENSKTVLGAFERASARTGGGIKLLVVGAAKEEVKEGVIYRSYLSEDELIQAYQGALLYLDLSLFEGFALQVLEAMACGVPVIASNRTSIPEIVGDAGILVDPDDHEAIAQAINRVLTDQELWHQMREKGLERAKQFSWEKTARETLAAYEEVLNGIS